MKWLLLPLLWVVAVVVAVGIAWRLWRGQHVVLRGRWSPQVIRLVVILLVFFGVGVPKTRSAPAPGPAADKGSGQADDGAAAVLTPKAVRAWEALERPGSSWTRFKQGFTLVQQDKTAGKVDPALVKLLPAHFRTLVEADLAGKAAAEKPADLLLALDDLEAAGYFDHWAGAYLWRKTAGADPQDLFTLYARLHRHARLTNTLIRAAAQGKPILLPPRAWMGKAGRPVGGPALSAEQFAGIVGEVYAEADDGTWKQDATAVFVLAEGSAPVSLYHGGRRLTPAAGETFRFGRLDLLDVPAGDKPVVLDHAWMGKVTLPAGKPAGVWDLPGCLSDDGKAALNKAVADALGGSEEAAEKVERALPLAHRAVRDALKGSPNAKGAARLRLVLSLFDDAVMPPLPKVVPAGGFAEDEAGLPITGPPR
jgi:hypothetical protein